MSPANTPTNSPVLLTQTLLLYAPPPNMWGLVPFPLLGLPPVHGPSQYLAAKQGTNIPKFYYSIPPNPQYGGYICPWGYPPRVFPDAALPPSNPQPTYNALSNPPAQLNEVQVHTEKGWATNPMVPTQVQPRRNLARLQGPSVCVVGCYGHLPGFSPQC